MRKGPKAECRSGFYAVDGQDFVVLRGDLTSRSTNGPAGRGAAVTLNSNGTVTVLKASRPGEAARIANATGARNLATQHEIISTSATTEISSTIATRPLSGLPACPPDICGSVTSGPPVATLDTSNNAPLETVKAIDSAAALLQIVPIANIGASVVRAAVAGGSGEAGEAGMQLAGIVGLNWFRKLDTAVDVANTVTRNRQVGLAFERSVGIVGPKKAINLPDGRRLFPDEVTPFALTEAKNVKRLSFTKQLRDYSAYAKSKNLDFILRTPKGTKLSGPLKKAIANGDIFHNPPKK